MHNAGKEESLKAQLVIVTGLLLVYFLFRKLIFLYSSLSLGLIFLFIPFIGNRIVSLWFKSAELLGWINSRILLTMVYFLCLVPVSLLFRLFNKNPLTLKNTRASLYVERNHTYISKDLENIW
ncbi:MAG: SxtJ family membrane protein [Thermodesulfovibrionales bacterium]